MLDKILTALKENNISTYSINDITQETIELFFIKKYLDMRRQKEVHHYTITLYCDFMKDNVKMRGSSSVSIYNGMTEKEIKETLQNAYYAASFVCNPYYELPTGKKEEHIQMKSSLSDCTLAENAGKITYALFTNDTKENVFINSAEVFIEKTTCHILNSSGIDVSYDKHTVQGEFVAQCTAPQDVETYHSFSYDDLETEALKTKVSQALEMTGARAKAKTAPYAGEYTVLISGEYVKEIFKYYLDRSNASLIYPKYSGYELGCSVQGEEVIGDPITIQLIAKEPYSQEGIPMINRPLITNGRLQTIHGNSRFSYYLKTTPTGLYDNIFVPAGTKSFEDMKTGKYLHIVNFSDFQMDIFSGHFGGEIRLAFLCDGETITPVTGGSINGSLLDAQKNLVFSKELQVEKEFEGPYAICFKNISVAGA